MVCASLKTLLTVEHYESLYWLFKLMRMFLDQLVNMLIILLNFCQVPIR